MNSAWTKRLPIALALGSALGCSSSGSRGATSTGGGSTSATSSSSGSGTGTSGAPASSSGSGSGGAPALFCTDGGYFVATLSGNQQDAWHDGSGGPLGTASFEQPAGVAVDLSGNVYVADQSANVIRKILPNGTTLTLSGNGSQGFADGDAGVSQYNQPIGLAVDPTGTLYVAEYQNNCIRKVAPDGTSSVFAGQCGTLGQEQDGVGALAAFNGPTGVAFDPQGNLDVSDASGGAIRRIAPDGTTTTLASHLDFPRGLSVDSTGRIFIADYNLGTVFLLASDGGVSSVASGFANPSGVAADTKGNLFVSQQGGNSVSEILASGQVVPVAGGAQAGSLDGPASVALLSQPGGLALDSAGHLFVADEGDFTVREIDPPCQTLVGSSATSTGAGSTTSGGTAGESTTSGTAGSTGSTSSGGSTTGGGVANLCGDAGCQPVLLASGQASPYSLALDSRYLFWTNSGAIERLTLDGGAVIQLASAGAPHGVVSDGQFVYWADESNGGMVLKVPVSGGVTTLLADGGDPFFLTVDQTNVYWSDNAGSRVASCPLNGGPVTTWASAGDGGASGPYGITLAGNALYWANFGDGTIMGRSLLGGAPFEVAAGQPEPNWLTSGGGELYWTDYAYGVADQSILGQGALDGGWQPFGPYGQSYWGVAVDAYATYATQYNGGGIVATLLDGGATEVLVPSGDPLTGIVADGHSIYWVDNGGGEVFQLTLR